MKLPRSAALTIAAVLLVAGAATSTVTATAASAAAPASAPSAQTKAIGDCVHARVEPRKVVSACADGGAYAVITHYGSWNDTVARGSGRLVLNDCRPTCAGGHFHHYPATFRFHRVVQTARGPRFAKLGVTYVKGGEQHDLELFLPTRPL